APSDVEQLRALPYLDYSEEKADPAKLGVTFLDRNRSFPGYNLYTSTSGAELALIDPVGQPIHSWTIPAGQVWNRAELLPNGDLLVIGGPQPARPQAKGRYLLRLSWRGKLLWQVDLASHHDIERLPDGRIFAFTTEHRLRPKIDPEIPTTDNPIAVFSAEGEKLEQVSLYDLVRAGPARLDLRTVRPKRSHGKRRTIDLLHANNMDWVESSRSAEEHPLYRPGNVLLTLRHQDTLAAIHWPSREVVWSWGRGEISGPHHGQVLDNGNVLLFDNGLAHKRSRVIELDPTTEEIVWSYQPPPDEPFFTRSGGACQRLANGNTLITDTNRGRAFEVTPEGDLAWEFFTPHIGPRGGRGVIIRMHRYSVEYVRAIRSRHR
ncbi:MAG: arylsulfotransferase family protein, partial [Acidobacteriota bacterium]